MDKVGIELQLKQNLEAQLKVILPLMEKMNAYTQTLDKQLSQAKGAKEINNRLKEMNNHLKNVSKANQEVVRTFKQFDGVSQSVNKATRNVGLFSQALKGIGGYLGPLTGLVGIYKVLQGLTAAASEGLDFQSKILGLGRKGFSTAEVQSIKNYALSSSASGSTILSPGEQIDAAAGALPILGHSKVRDAMPEYNRVATGLRQANIEMKSPEILSRFWELYAVPRTKQARESFDDQLYKVAVASGVDMSQLLYQSNVYGPGLIGRDPIKALTEVAYFAKESGAGLAGAGGGGRGRAGFIARSMDTMISQGRVPQATLEMWHHLGRLPGIEKYMTAKGRGHSYLIEQGTGQHVLHGTQRTADMGKITNTAFKEFLLNDRPAWMAEAGKDDEALIREMVLMSAQAAKITGTPTEMMDQFFKLPDAKQKQLLSVVSGSNQLVSTGVMQYGGVGKYKTGVDIFQGSVAGVPAMGAGPVSIQQKFEEFTAQFKSFADAFMNTPEVVKGLTDGMNGLIEIMKLLNANVEPLAKWATGQTTFEKNLNPGHLLDTGTSHAGTHPLGGYTTGDLAHDWNRARKAVMRVGQQAVDLLHLTPPPGLAFDTSNTPTLLPSIITPSGKVIKNPTAAQIAQTNKDIIQWQKKHGIPPAPEGTTGMMSYNGLGGSPMHGHGNFFVPPPMINVTVNHETNLDGKTIAKHTTNHVTKALVKSGQTMRRGASKAGGSHTTGVLNSGGGQSN